MSLTPLCLLWFQQPDAIQVHPAGEKGSCQVGKRACWDQSPIGMFPLKLLFNTGSLDSASSLVAASPSLTLTCGSGVFWCRYSCFRFPCKYKSIVIGHPEDGPPPAFISRLCVWFLCMFHFDFAHPLHSGSLLFAGETCIFSCCHFEFCQSVFFFMFSMAARCAVLHPSVHIHLCTSVL